MAEGCGLEMPEDDLSDRVEEATAAYIAAQIHPLGPAARKRALDEMLDRAVADAVDTCRRAIAANERFVAACRHWERAAQEGGYWLSPLEARAAVCQREAAEWGVLAERRCREARGIDRAVGFERRGAVGARVAPTPQELDDWLVAAGGGRRSPDRLRPRGRELRALESGHLDGG